MPLFWRVQTVAKLYGEESVRVAREMMQGNQQNRNLFGFGPGMGGLFGGSRCIQGLSEADDNAS